MYPFRSLLLFSIFGGVCIFAKTGEEIADSLYQHPNECKDPSDGGIWAPLQGENPDCGAGIKCNYPQQWCSATSDPNQSQTKPNLNCVSLPPDCQTAIAEADTTAASVATDTTTFSSVDTTTQATTSSSVASSSASSPTTRRSPQSTQSAASTTAAPGGAPGCKDNHEFCCFWADKGQCDQNPGWMRTNCQGSCGTCGCKASDFRSCKVKVTTTGCKYTNGGAGGKGNKVRIQLGGGPGLAAMGFGNQGNSNSGSNRVTVPIQGSMFGNGGAGTSGNGNQPNMVKIPVGGGMGMGGMGMQPGMGMGMQPGMGMGMQPGMGMGMQPGMGMGMNGMPGQTPGGSGNGKQMVTIPVGRRKRHFMPRWFN